MKTRHRLHMFHISHPQTSGADPPPGQPFSHCAFSRSRQSVTGSLCSRSGASARGSSAPPPRGGGGARPSALGGDTLLNHRQRFSQGEAMNSQCRVDDKREKQVQKVVCVLSEHQIKDCE